MKKFVCLLFVLGLISCQKNEIPDGYVESEHFRFDGHDYVRFTNDGYTNFVVVHDPDCDCPSRW